MSYFPCQKCGQFVGVIGQTVYSCGCKPDGLPTPPPAATSVSSTYLRYLDMMRDRSGK